MASGARISLVVDQASEDRVFKQLETLLAGTRREGKEIVKQISRMAANSAAKLTIPNTGRNTPMSGSRSAVRMPRMEDKFRPLVEAKSVFSGKFYVVNKGKNSGKRSNKKRKRGSGFAGLQHERRVMRGSQGELVIYTTKPIKRDDERKLAFRPVKKLIKAWDKKRRSWHYIPTLSTKKYDKESPQGKIPYFFAAKQAWLYSQGRLAKTMRLLNASGKLRKLGHMYDELHRQDNPAVTMFNTSEYAPKRGGRMVPRAALYQAYKGYMHMLEKHKERILAKARAK